VRRPERIAFALVVAMTTLVASGATRADDEDEESNPHARAAGGSMPGVFEPPPDEEKPDPSLPAGTIAVDLRDPDGHPVAGEIVTLGSVTNSVAKGESRKHTQATTDAGGRALFSGLDTASVVAHRVSVGFQGGAFAAPPFRLDQVKAMQVVLHVYPVARDLQTALVVTEAIVAGEVRDDRIQVEEVLTVYNLGKTAWQPDGVTMSLPSGFKAFRAQASMSDQGVDEFEGAAKLRGTFPPGRHTLEFQWQLPWSGDKDVDFGVGLPPHVAGARVLIPVSATITLTADGFPPPIVRRGTQGQRFLVTERRVRPDEPKLTSLSIGIHGLPTEGPDRAVATFLSACAVAAGLAYAFSRRPMPLASGDADAARDVLLDELAALERARVAGEIGPKTYDRVRRELVDALARTLAPA
jgi:hypothetical protein